MSDGEQCVVCDEPIPESYRKHDDNAPVYADEYVVHLGCQDELFEWSIEAVNGRVGRWPHCPNGCGPLDPDGTCPDCGYGVTDE